MRSRILFPTLSVAVLATVFAGYGGGEAAQKRAYRAQESVAKERLRLVEKYQDCVRKADLDVAARRACETYAASAEALR